MTDFIRFPHTPHLAWLGEGQPREDKVLGEDEASELLSHDLIVEEKVDGANVGLSVDEDGRLRVQNRGSYILADQCHRQFRPLFRWLGPREARLAEALYPHLMLFGEWCYAVHSVRYTRLPDWFLAFDVYDKVEGRFWSAARRDDLAAELGLTVVPRLGEGRFDVPTLQRFLTRSRLTEHPPEGLYVRQDRDGYLRERAKLVRAEFVQAIEEHWSRRPLETNSLAST